MMWSHWCDIKHLLRSKKLTSYGQIFFIHCKCITFFLLLSSIVVTSTTYFGTPIACEQSKASIREEVVDNYCWIEGTYSVAKAHRKDQDSIYPGVAHSTKDDEKLYYSYYQWVPFVLAIQAALFAIPYHVWSSWESGKIQSGYNWCTKNDGKHAFLRNQNLGFWVARYLFCEAMCLVNILVQMAMLDRIFSGMFYRYGIEVMHWLAVAYTDRRDPMMYLFPRLTKCQYMISGPGGNLMTLEALCVLPINIINEKVFVLMWIFFVLTGVLLLLLVIYRLSLIMCSSLRVFVIAFYSQTDEQMKSILKTLSFGQWFYLYILRQNMEFQEIRSMILAEDLSPA